MPHKPRVLIADDDASMRAFLHAALTREGFETEQVTNGRDALARLKEDLFDVVLLDVDMPVLDGLRTMRAIRASDEFRTLPVILVTGSIDEADRIRALEGGADDYLGKPVQVRELAARVRAQVREREAWTAEVELGRQTRRNLTAALEGLASSTSLLTLSADLVERLPGALALDGAAILHMAAGTVRSIAAGGDLAKVFPPTKAVPEPLGGEIADRAGSGPWLQSASSAELPSTAPLDVAYVPFRLGATAAPIGCLVYASRPGGSSGALSHRFPDLIDATEVIVVMLRPAVERAETADAAITRIRQIITDESFRILLQPIVRVDSAALVGVEALTRFDDGTSPELLFDEAATFGLAGPLERATATAAVATAAPIPPGVALSINLSADVIEHEPGLAELFETVDRPVIVELTEHERIDDYAAVRAALKRLGSNVRLAIDDAGSGYASLRHIFALEPAFVKLDAEWVRDIDRDPVRRALVSGLVYFARETGCELIGEGIETEAELAALRDLGVGLGQGFLLGRPMPASEVR